MNHSSGVNSAKSKPRNGLIQNANPVVSMSVDEWIFFKIVRSPESHSINWMAVFINQ